MGVLQFDGATGQLKWETLAAPLANVTDGAWTMAALVKIADFGHFNGIAYMLSGIGAGTSEAGLSYSSSVSSMTVDVESGRTFPSDFSSTTTTYLFAVSKAAGSSIPRLGWKAAGGGWTHEDSGDGTLADQVDGAQIQIGTWQDTDHFEGHIGLVAFWEGAMSDGDKEALDDNWRTSDWWTSAHGQPVFLAELNVIGLIVVDLAGNASDLTDISVLLDAGETLNSWNFDGEGSGPEPTYGGSPRRGVASVA
jgi:hypothetical protein